MKTPSSRVLIIASAVALLLVGVAAVAFAWGASSVGPPVTHAAWPSGMPGNPRPGQIATTTVNGTVARKSGTALVVTTAAGKQVTINVSPATRYAVRGVATPTLANVSIGNRIAVQGTLNKDGSLDATLVQVTANGQPGTGGAGRNPGGRGGAPSRAPGPVQSPVPSSSGPTN
jgi:hypothetical protein